MKKLFLLSTMLPMLLLAGCNKEDVEDEKKKQIQCPLGYMGADCSTQITPSKITLTKIQVTKFPQITTNGASWDVGSGPELFVRFGITTVLYESGYYDDAISGTIYTFTPSPALELNATAQYAIELWDYDTISASDKICSGTFYIYNDTDGFPSVVERSNEIFAIKLHVLYSW
jgi:hypothetical protein